MTPATHVHYGYISYIRGLSAFSAAMQDEKTALFTFYADASTPRVIANGPLRVVTRVGRLTLYRDPSTNGDFARPASFRDGTPILVARFRQQVVSDTVASGGRVSGLARGYGMALAVMLVLTIASLARFRRTRPPGSNATRTSSTSGPGRRRSTR